MKLKRICDGCHKIYYCEQPKSEKDFIHVVLCRRCINLLYQVAQRVDLNNLQVQKKAFQEACNIRIQKYLSRIAKEGLSKGQEM
jgi:hypothetical protein